MKNNKKTILLVDDTIISRNILRKNFSGEYNILIAQDGIEALQVLSRKFRKIDLVLLNLILPKLSGQDVIKRMQIDEKLKFIPIIAMTGIDNLEQAGIALDLGAVEIFAKPFNITILRQRIKNVLGIANKSKPIKNMNEFVKWRASRYSEVITAKAICNVEFCVTKDEVSSISINFVQDMVEQWETTWTEFLQHFIKKFVSTEYIPLAFHTFSCANLLENYKNGNNEIQIDLIYSFADAEELWGRTFAYLIDAEDGNIYCNFYINDITEEKKTVLSLKQRVELDPVTTLYNRAYAENIINLSLGNKKIPGAFIILDIDNFKSVNDTMGHIYGDALLSEIGRRCKEFMEPGDVAGRYGGDEFIIYMAGVDIRQAKPKVNGLHCALNVVFSQVTEFFNFSCSMGVAMFPDDGDNYLDLFSKADAALYYSKDQGKNQCNFYNDKMQWRTSKDLSINEKINENNEVGVNFRENMFEYVFRILTDVHDLEKSIPMVFDLVGRSHALSRISLFPIKSEGKCLRNYYEWNNIGIGIPNNATRHMTREFIEAVGEDFGENDNLIAFDVAKLKSSKLRLWCSQRGILSLILYKIFDESGKLYAIISFEQCDRQRHDNGKKNKFLGNLAMLVGIFFMKEARLSLLAKYYKIHKSILQRTCSVFYIIDKNTGDLLYCSDHKKNILPNDIVKLQCYKKLRKRETLCTGCPLKNKYAGKNHKPIFFTTPQGRTFLEFVWEESGLYPNKNTALLCLYDVTKWAKLQVKLQKPVHQDELTGLLTRTCFFSKTEQMLKDNKETDYVLFVLNIEHFKMINDLFGVETGDNTLRFVANKLSAMYGSNSTIARLYADRFAVCLARKNFDVHSFMDIVVKDFNSFSNNFKIIVDIGIYNVDDTSVPVRQMVDRAKIALQTVRGSYKNSFAYYDNAWREKLVMEHRLMADLEGALEAGEIVPYYQPYFDLKTREILGAEVLARWIHPNLGVVAPTLFIPIFERNGMIEQLDHYMWREACKFISGQKQQNNNIVPISVNISRVNFYNPNLSKNIIALTEEYAVPPEMLRLEITESVYAQGKDIMFNTIKELQAYGFKILMDDFGSGYSSLNMLKDIKVDMLKIDMRFLGYCSDVSRAYKILLAVADLGRRLEIPVIAEGIETREDTDKLRNMGIDAGQGFYFAMPMPGGTFVNILRNIKS